ncbi:MAG: CC0125/CC1285 family lipoprotein, partial [Brevundimonas sp.]
MSAGTMLFMSRSADRARPVAPRRVSMRLRFLKPVLLATAAALALSACATATPYGPAGVDSRYGYSDQRVDADRYRVSFAG